jgi:PAS domain S-box
MLDERSRNGRSRGELTFIKKDGSKFPGEISTNVFMDKNGIMDTFMIIRDISGRKNAEYFFLISFIE